MTIDGTPAVEACVGAGGGGGTYTIRVGGCRFAQPPINNARLHHKNGKALSFTSLGILSFPTSHTHRPSLVEDNPTVCHSDPALREKNLLLVAAVQRCDCCPASFPNYSGHLIIQKSSANPFLRLLTTGAGRVDNGRYSGRMKTI